MAKIERKMLSNRTGYAGTAGHGYFSMVMAIIVMGAGLPIILIGSRVIPVDPDSVHAPYWILQVVGGIFASAGLMLLIASIRAIAKRRRRDDLLMRRPREPWLADHPWDKLRATHSSLGAAFQYFWGALFMSIFMSVFNWWAFFSDRSNFFIIGIVGIFDLIILIIFGSALYQLIRFLRYGSSEVRFGSFPLFLGDEIRLRFKASSPILAPKIVFTLRHIEELYEKRGSGDDASPTLVCYELYSDEKTVELDGRSRMGAPDLEIAFKLPEGQFQTRLCEMPAYYWELEAHAQTEGVDYNAKFLLPVYQKLS